MAFDSSVSTYKTANENGCLMDSDAESLKGTPNSVLSSTWITKAVGVDTLNIGKGDVITVHDATAMFTPVQVAADKSVHIEFEVNLTLELNLTTSSAGTAMFAMGLKDFAGVTPTSVQATITRKLPSDYPLVINVNEVVEVADQISFMIWHTQSISTTVNAFVYVTVRGQISNTDIGFGQLFPVTES